MLLFDMNMYLIFYKTFIIFQYNIRLIEMCTVIKMPSTIPGKYLIGFNFSSDFTADKNFCLIRCLKQRKCKSVNYHSHTTECQMNTATHTDQPSALIPSPDLKQYYSLDNINEDILRECAWHNCPKDLICVPVPYGSQNPFQCTIHTFSSVPVLSTTTTMTTTTAPMTTRTTTITTTTTTSVICSDGCTNCMQQHYKIGQLTYQPVGCFHAPGHLADNPLPILLDSFRGNIDWYNLHLTIEQCANAAHANGSKYFGIEYYGECWVAMTFDPSMFTLTSASSCSNGCPLGVAAADYMMIYTFM